MNLFIYKGFDLKFLKNIQEMPLIKDDLSERINVLSYNKKTRKKLEIALLNLDESDTAWITYQEYTLIHSRIDEAISEDGLNIKIYKNNLFPDYYPLELDISPDLAAEIENCLNAEHPDSISNECQNFINVYNSLIQVDDQLYGSFYNFEYEKLNGSVLNCYYPVGHLTSSLDSPDFNIFLNEDIEAYLRNIHLLLQSNAKKVGMRTTTGKISNRLQDSLMALSVFYGFTVQIFHEDLITNNKEEQELINIATNDIGIKGFTSFRKIPFYKNPDIDKQVVEISQSQIIREIIHQAENAYDTSNGYRYRDIFITASTGAGKSVMFQIPAIYLARKYKKLTIIIEPVKALMQDQKAKLIRNGYTRVEAFNSDLITQVEKESVLKRIKEGEIDLLYLSPETLLSYSIETIIGDREIGLLIIDEAHIVTTWGVGFRPDYWYLGGYINQLRNRIQTSKKYDRKIYHFPICAFTATAINGGLDDSVGETITSLYMENPVKYIGYTKRNNISFKISNKSDKRLPKSDYEEAKSHDLNKKLQQWIGNNEKTIVYFPYASLAGEAHKGSNSFAGITTGKEIGIYTGRNIDSKSIELFNAEKRETFDKFRNGQSPVMYATKAFGMGVDIDDIQNVYHYAVTGNLCDYVQEIGRAARKSSIHGIAMTDYYYNDLDFMKALFGMSQIKQYQIKKVLSGIYDIHKSKGFARSFLISPQSFTYIFKGKEESCVNQLKTCLLMLEKDLYDKYNFKVLISRPQSVFTKAFVIIRSDSLDTVLKSKYGNCFHFIQKGRYHEKQADGTEISDEGDIYSVDLKLIWEKFHPNISFPQFKYWYFNKDSTAKDKIEIMPEIKNCFAARQKVTLEACKDLLLCDIRTQILDDFEYIANALYEKLHKQYFSSDEFARIISDRYGMTMARMIANSIFSLVDPNNTCVKFRSNEATGKTDYYIANGNFKEYLRKSITKSRVVRNISLIHGEQYSTYMCMEKDEWSALALKLLSIFGYITYEIAGGEEPEMFIRLNDPNKIKGIVLGNIYYTNGYVTKAIQKHDRDIQILNHFFQDLTTDQDRWNYIEDYFLGYDVLINAPIVYKTVEMKKAIDKVHSYPTNDIKDWKSLYYFFDDADTILLKSLENISIPIPEFLETVIKKSKLGDEILMSWPSKNTLICQHETDDATLEKFASMGWNAYRISCIDKDKIKKELS